MRLSPTLTGCALMLLAGAAAADTFVPGSADDPRVARLEVLPAGSIHDVGQTQQIIVRAHYTDGRAEDVTRWVKWSSSDETVCRVDDDGAASVVYYRNGTIKIGVWGQDVRMTPDVVGVRQNLKLIVDHGQVPSSVNNDVEANWGATLGGDYHVWRSGPGITADGRIIFGPQDGHWDVEFWCDNMFDTHYLQVAFDAGFQNAPTNATGLLDAFLGAPRTFGGTMRAKF